MMQPGIGVGTEGLDLPDGTLGFRSVSSVAASLRRRGERTGNQSSLNVGIKNSCLDLPGAFDLHEDAVVARLREAIGEADFGRKRVW